MVWLVGAVANGGRFNINKKLFNILIKEFSSDVGYGTVDVGCLGVGV